MIYSVYKLNKQGDNMQPWYTPFPIWNLFVPCPVLTVASWPTYRFLKRQVRWSGIPISFRTFQNHPQILVCVCVFFKLFLWRRFPINLSKIRIEFKNHLDWCIWTEEYVAFFGHGSKLSMIDEVKSPWLIASDAYTECVVCSLLHCVDIEHSAQRFIKIEYFLCFSFRRLIDGLLKHW